MKKIISSSILLTILILIDLTSTTHATVGGEIFINDFKYNPADESIYYIQQSFGGRGCPPELIKLDLNSEKKETVFSCSQGEKLLSESNNYNSSLVNTEIERLTQNFKPLIPLNLKLNNISIKVNFDREERFEQLSEVMRRHFTATVYQNNNKIKEFSIVGCSLDQPFTFQGYSIPGYNKRIALLLSAKGDCMEGGYIYENLYTIAGVDNLNKMVTGNFYKSLSSALTPNEGNLIVYNTTKAQTQNLSISQFIELLIQIGVISPDKAVAVRAIFGL